MARVAVVTGSNKGIGFEIARSLAGAAEELHLIIACRSKRRGEKAMEKLQKEFPGQSFQFGKLDISESQSIRTFSDNVAEEHGRIDILVHNAAILFKDHDPTPFEGQAELTFQVNYFGTQLLNKRLLPLVQKGTKPRIVFVSSQMARSAFIGSSSSIKGRWKKVKTESDISALANEFVAAVKTGTHEAKGWPDTCYGTSKLAGR